MAPAAESENVNNAALRIYRGRTRLHHQLRHQIRARQACQGKTAKTALVVKGAWLAGELPGRQKRLVEGWAELHQTELMDDWQRLEQRIPPKAIAPLC